MAIEKRLFCPKCQGTNIQEQLIPPIAPPHMISMDDLVEKGSAAWEPAVLIREHWRATCEDCGYLVEFYA